VLRGWKSGQILNLLVRAPLRKLRVGYVNSGDNSVFRKNARLGLELTTKKFPAYSSLTR